MLISKPKPLEEILNYLKTYNSTLLMACNGCGESFGNSELRQLKSLAEKLQDNGVHIAETLCVDFLCEPILVKHWLKPTENKADFDSVLVVSCGIGAQVVSQEATVPAFPACDTVTMGGRFGQAWGKQLCKECGQCILPYTGGVCPLTACSKELLNGPCGGSQNGRCELFPDTRPCGWHLIYERLKTAGRTDLLTGDPLLKDHSKKEPPLELVTLRNQLMEKEFEAI